MGIASLSSHQRVLTRSVDGLRAKVDAIGKAVEVDVKVNRGLQAGASRQFTTNVIELGSQLGNTLVLVDGAVAPTHVRVTLTHSVFGILADVEALAPGVTVQGDPLAMGEHRTSCTLPLNLGVGANEIEIARPASTKIADTVQTLRSHTEVARGRLPRDPVLLYAGLALCVLTLFAVIYAVFPSQRDFVVALNLPEDRLAVPTTQTRDFPSALQSQLTNAGLENSLRVTAPEDGLVMVNGYLQDVHVASFRGLQSWVDAQSDAPAIVWDVQRRSSLGPLPSVGMVRLSEPAALVLTRGEVIEVGNEFSDDWVLSGIDATHYTLNRDGETQRIPLPRQ